MRRWLNTVQLDYQWGEKGPKLRSVGESVLQNVRQPGNVADIEILRGR